MDTNHNGSSAILTGVLTFAFLVLIKSPFVKDGLRLREIQNIFTSELPLAVDSSLFIQDCSLNRKGLSIYAASSGHYDKEDFSEEQAVDCFYCLTRFNHERLESLEILMRKNRPIRVILQDSLFKTIADFSFSLEKPADRKKLDSLYTKSATNRAGERRTISADKSSRDFFPRVRLH